MEEQPELVYNCDGCNCEILPSRDPRINCTACEDYDLCWNCHSSGRTSGTHEIWHEQLIIRPVPVACPVRIIEVPAQRAYDPYSSSDPYWGHMVTPQRTASDLFCRLAHAIYTYVDQTVEPRNTSWLEPEKCSFIIDLLGFSPEENTFRTIYQTGQQNGGGIAWSDEEIALIYEQYGWQHQMVTRDFHQHMGRSTPEGMPLLSHEGFVSMMLNDALVDPDAFCVRLNRLLGQIPRLLDPLTGTYFVRRDVPRGCWPDAPDEEAVWKCHMIQKQRAEKTEEDSEESGDEELKENIKFVQIGYAPRPRAQGKKVLCNDGQWYYQHKFTGNLRDLGY